MARKARVQFPGALYHVLDRGDHRELIVRDDADRERFLHTLAEVCQRTGWRLHAFVLLSNHYHWLLETPEPNLISGMQWFQTTYTMRFNRRHRLSGHLFPGRYKAVVVNPEERGYFVTLSDYIHLNPIRARIVGLQERLVDYRWSSYPAYVMPQKRSVWLETADVLAELGLPDNADGRRRYAERMRARAVEELMVDNAARTKQGTNQWCLGNESFREKVLRLLDRTSDKLRARREVDSSVRRTHDETEALRIIRVGLELFALKASDATALRKGDERKLAIAAVVRRHTAVPRAWLAAQLELGHVSRLRDAAWQKNRRVVSLVEELENRARFSD